MGARIFLQKRDMSQFSKLDYRTDCSSVNSASSSSPKSLNQLLRKAISREREWKIRKYSKNDNQDTFQGAKVFNNFSVDNFLEKTQNVYL